MTITILLYISLTSLKVRNYADKYKTHECAKGRKLAHTLLHIKIGLGFYI